MVNAENGVKAAVYPVEEELTPVPKVIYKRGSTSIYVNFKLKKTH